MRHPVAVGPLLKQRPKCEAAPFKEVTDRFWKGAKGDSREPKTEEQQENSGKARTRKNSNLTKTITDWR